MYKQFLSLALLVLTTFSPSISFAESTINAVIASVNGRAITLTDLKSRISSRHSITLNDISHDTDLRASLDQMITEYLIEEEAKQRQLSVNQSDIDNYIREIAAQNSLSLDDFKRELSREKIDFEDYKSKVRFDILRSKIASVVFREGVPVSEEEVDAYIKQHAELTKAGEKVKLRQVFLSNIAKSEEELKKALEEIETKIKEGVEFSEIAKKHSDSHDAPEGGLIGLVVLAELNPTIQDAILLLNEGETSEAIPTDRGIFFFHVEKKLTGDSNAIKEDVRRMLENQKLQEKLTKYFAIDLYNKHSVEKKV